MAAVTASALPNFEREHGADVWAVVILKLTDTEEALMYIWWIAGFIWGEIAGQIIWGR